jgi:hypothetical protein
MIENIRSEILSIEGAADDACVEEDYVVISITSYSNNNLDLYFLRNK